MERMNKLWGEGEEDYLYMVIGTNATAAWLRKMCPWRQCSLVLKKLADELAKPLTIIYQKSWSSGQVWEDCRLADMTPLYKKDRKEDWKLQAFQPDLRAG